MKNSRKKKDRSAEKNENSYKNLLDIVNHAQSLFIQAASPRELFHRLLNELLALTQSEFGFIGEVFFTDQAAPYVKTLAISDISWNKETGNLYKQHAAAGMRFSNLKTLYGVTLITGKAIISNNPSTDPLRGELPTGHSPLNSYLGLPIFFGERLVGMLGAANRPGGYDEELAGYLQPLLTTCGNIIEAYRNNYLRRQAEEAFKIREAYLEVIAQIGQELLCCSVDVHNKTKECIQPLLGRLGVTAGVDRVYIFQNHSDAKGNLLCSQRYEWVAEGIESQAGNPNLQDFPYEKGGFSRWAKLMTRRDFIDGSIVDFPQSERSILAEQGIRSLLAVPIFTDIGWWGFLGLDVCKTEHKFTNGEIALLQSAVTTFGQFFNLISAEEEKSRLQKQLNYAQKMESIGRLAGGIAHNFNNILCGVLGYASLLKSQSDFSDDIVKCVDKIEFSAQRASILTKNLLGFARCGKYEVEPLECNQIISTILSFLESMLDKGILAENICRCEDFGIMGDKNLIQQAILHICLNARDAMPNGGKIKISSKIRTFNAPHAIRGIEVPPERYLILQITDSGEGMTEDVMSRVFEPFFTTKRENGKTGLGLAMVYGIVKNHGGYINVQSEPDKGATFTLYFPAIRIEPKKTNPDCLRLVQK